MMRQGLYGWVVIWAFSAGFAAAAGNEGQADLDKATEIKLVAENVEDLNLVVNLAQSALTKGLDDKGQEYAKKLLASTLIQRATLYSKAIFDQNPPDQRWARLRTAALVDLERALKNDDQSPEAHYLIARLSSLPGGDQKRAKEAADQAIKLAGDDQRLKANALVVRANLTEDEKQRQSDLDEAVKLAPGNAEALRTRGLSYLLQNKPELAIADLDAAAKADPKNVDVQQARGLTFIVLKKYDDAISAFDKVIELAPEATLPYAHRARARMAKGDNQAALDDLNRALDKEDDNPAILLMRARVYQQLGEKDKARTDVENALKEQPGLGPALGLRAILAAGSGEFKQAIADVKELQKIAPKSPELQLQLGLLHSAAKQPRKALEAYEAVLKLDDKNFHALRGQADSLLNTGKHAEAVEVYVKAHLLKPDDTGILNNYAWVLATSPDDKVRNPKKSLELALEAVRLTESKQPHILSTLAAAYAENGDWDNAVKWSEKAVKESADEGETSDQLGKELASYKEKKPWREVINDPDVADDEVDKKGKEK